MADISAHIDTILQAAANPKADLAAVNEAIVALNRVRYLPTLTVQLVLAAFIMDSCTQEELRRSYIDLITPEDVKWRRRRWCKSKGLCEHFGKLFDRYQVVITDPYLSHEADKVFCNCECYRGAHSDEDESSDKEY